MKQVFKKNRIKLVYKQIDFYYVRNIRAGLLYGINRFKNIKIFL
jgi:hypothetical protein